MSILDRFKRGNFRDDDSAFSSQAKPSQAGLKPSAVKLAALASAGLVAVVGALGSFNTIDQNDRGLVYTFGKLSTKDKADIRQPGLNFKFPLVQEIRTTKVVLQEKILENESIYTKDNQEIHGNISIQFTVPEDNLIDIALNNPNYEAIMVTNVRQALKDSFGKAEATNIASNRDAVMATASSNVKSSVADALHINVHKVQLPNFEFEPNFKAAIATAVNMKAQAESARLEVEKDKNKADSAIQTARGKAESTKLQADADYVRATKEADGELYKLNKQAEGQQRLAGAIGQGNLRDYWFNQTWNGQLPAVSGGQAIVSTDLAGIASAATRKAAPAPAPAAQ